LAPGRKNQGFIERGAVVKKRPGAHVVCMGGKPQTKVLEEQISGKYKNPKRVIQGTWDPVRGRDGKKLNRIRTPFN